MGEVIPFRSAGRRRLTESAPGAEAEILFFLGVRYCRQQDESQPGAGQDSKDHDSEGAGGGKGDHPRRGSAPRTRRKKRA